MRILIVLLIATLIVDGVTAQNMSNETLQVNESVKANESVQTNETVNEPEEPEPSGSVMDKVLKIFTSSAVAIKSQVMEITAFLTDIEHKPVEDEQIDFIIDNEKVGEKYTDSQGVATLQYDIDKLEPGIYEVSVQHENLKEDESLILQEEEELVAPVTDPNVAAITCDYETVEVEEIKYFDDLRIVCRKEYDNQTNASMGTICTDKIVRNAETVSKPVLRCKKDTKRIMLGEQTLEFEKEHRNCNIVGDMIECDSTCYMLNGKRECGDGDGDGVCESGETCHRYKIENNEIKAPRVYNGRLEVQR